MITWFWGMGAVIQSIATNLCSHPLKWVGFLYDKLKKVFVGVGGANAHCCGEAVSNVALRVPGLILRRTPGVLRCVLCMFSTVSA